MATTVQVTAILEREGDGYVALCPELDIASQGDTLVSVRMPSQQTISTTRAARLFRATSGSVLALMLLSACSEPGGDATVESGSSAAPTGSDTGG
jgi:hypothetical protein